MVDYFLMVISHWHPMNFYETSSFIYCSGVGVTYLAMLIIDWVSLRLCLRSAIFVTLLVYNSEKLVDVLG